MPGLSQHLHSPLNSDRTPTGMDDGTQAHAQDKDPPPTRSASAIASLTTSSAPTTQNQPGHGTTEEREGRKR